MDTLEPLIIRLGTALKEREWKIATAESCTGGGVAFYLTHLSGSSAWFERGFITYSNASKEELLGVQHSTLLEHGAVSESVAREMAEGALAQSQAQVSIAITGIAGPEGGTMEKPVGTVWFAWAGIHRETITRLQKLSGDRDAIREQAIKIAIETLLTFIY